MTRIPSVLSLPGVASPCWSSEAWGRGLSFDAPAFPAPLNVAFLDYVVAEHAQRFLDPLQPCPFVPAHFPAHSCDDCRPRTDISASATGIRLTSRPATTWPPTQVRALSKISLWCQWGSRPAPFRYPIWRHRKNRTSLDRTINKKSRLISLVFRGCGPHRHIMCGNRCSPIVRIELVHRLKRQPPPVSFARV